MTIQAVAISCLATRRQLLVEIHGLTLSLSKKTSVEFSDLKERLCMRITTDEDLVYLRSLGAGHNYI